MHVNTGHKKFVYTSEATFFFFVCFFFSNNSVDLFFLLVVIELHICALLFTTDSIIGNTRYFKELNLL